MKRNEIDTIHKVGVALWCLSRLRDDEVITREEYLGLTRLLVGVLEEILKGAK